jgi:hypothetical protein
MYARFCAVVCACVDWGSNGGYDSDYCNVDAADTSVDAAAYYYDSDSEEGIEFFDAGIRSFYSQFFFCIVYIAAATVQVPNCCRAMRLSNAELFVA